MLVYDSFSLAKCLHLLHERAAKNAFIPIMFLPKEKKSAVCLHFWKNGLFSALKSILANHTFFVVVCLASASVLLSLDAMFLTNYSRKKPKKEPFLSFFVSLMIFLKALSKDNFLFLQRKHDYYFSTRNIISLCERAFEQNIGAYGKNKSAGGRALVFF